MKRRRGNLVLTGFIIVILVLFLLGINNLSNIDKLLDYLKNFHISIGERDVRVYFSPNGGAQSAIISEMSNAKKEILIAMYYFTSRPIAQAVVRAKERRVDVKIVLDESQVSEKFSKYKYLLKNKVKMRIDRRGGLMHNKFAVIDGETVITGSYNWTRSAEVKNRENLIIIKNKTLAQRYIWEFNRLWARARP